MCNAHAASRNGCGGRRDDGDGICDCDGVDDDDADDDTKTGTAPVVKR